MKRIAHIKTHKDITVKKINEIIDQLNEANRINVTLSFQLKAAKQAAYRVIYNPDRKDLINLSKKQVKDLNFINH